MAEDPLHHVHRDAFDRILKNLDKLKPESISILQALKTAMRWNATDPQITCQLLTTDHGEDDGTCVLIAGPVNGLHITLFSQNPDELVSAVERTTKIPWHRKPKFARLDEKMVQTIMAAMEPKGKCTEYSELIDLYWLPADQALALPEPLLPEGVGFRDLTVDDAATIAEMWPIGGPQAQMIMASSIRFNGGVAAVDKQAQLLGWALWGMCGGLAHVFVYPEHRRRGLARLLVTAMAKRIARRGLDVTANAASRNQPMHTLLGSLGFQHAFSNRFIQFTFASPLPENA